jgi:hypothetical protein
MEERTFTQDQIKEATLVVSCWAAQNYWNYHMKLPSGTILEFNPGRFKKHQTRLFEKVLGLSEE